MAWTDLRILGFASLLLSCKEPAAAQEISWACSPVGTPCDSDDACCSGSCTDGACAQAEKAACTHDGPPVVVRVMEEGTRVETMLADETHVYLEIGKVAGQDGIPSPKHRLSRIDKRSGKMEIFFEGPFESFVLSDTHVYIGSSRLAKDSAFLQPLGFIGAPTLIPMMLRDGFYYALSEDRTTLQRVPETGGLGELVAFSEDPILAAAEVEDDVFVIMNRLGVFTVDIEFFVPEQLVAIENDVLQAFSTETNVYWIEMVPVPSKPDGERLRGFPADPNLLLPEGLRYLVSSDEQHLYVAGVIESDDAEALAIDRTTHEIEPILEGFAPFPMLVDPEGCAYFVEPAASALFRAPAP